MPDISSSLSKREVNARQNTYTKSEIDLKDGAIQAIAEAAQTTADAAEKKNQEQDQLIAELQKSAHTHSNKGVLDKIEQPYTTAERDKLAGLENYTHPTHTAHTKGFYKFASDGEGHVADAEKVTASDLYNAGGVIKNFLNFADYTGHMPIAFMSIGTSGSFGDYAKFIVDTRETSVSKMFMLSIGGNGVEGSLMLHGQNGSECVIFPNSNSSNSNRFHFFLPDKSGTVALIEDIPDIAVKQDKLTAGTNITINGNTISAKDTTYSDATQSAHGLMTAADKKKLDGMDLSKYLPKDGTAKKAELLSSGQMRSAYCHNDDATFSNGYVWFKIGTAIASGGYATITTTFLGICGYGKHALYTARVRLTSAGNVVESISFSESGRTGGMLTGLFRIVAINGEKNVTFELWAKGASRWEGTKIVILNEMYLAGGDHGNFWTLTSRGNADAKTAPTTGNMHVDSSDSSTCATATNASNAARWNGLINDVDTYNSSDTWILVKKDNRIQHRYAGELDVNSAKTLVDSGWQKPTFPSGVKSSSIRYRKQGKIVSVTGYVQFSTAQTTITVFTLPTGYRPPAKIQQFNAVDSSAQASFLTKIDTDGKVGFFGKTQGFFTTATEYYMHCTFFVD